MSGVKFDKSIKYLEDQLNIQKNNKQLILDIITNIGLILNKNSSNNDKELLGVLTVSNDFLQDISDNITTIKQLNVEISNITEELNEIMKEQAQNSKTKEYYIATLSNIKNHIAQYTEKFQESQKKLDIDNNDFNNFINENNFKYTFDTIENTSNNINTYELTSFSVNNESTILPTTNEVEISDEEKGNYDKLEQDIVKNFSNNINIDENKVNEEMSNNEIIGSFQNNLAENSDIEEIVTNETVKQISYNSETNIFDYEHTTIDETETNVEESETEKKINQITDEFKETLTNLYNSGLTDLDTNSIISNYLKNLSSTDKNLENKIEESKTNEQISDDETIIDEPEVNILEIPEETINNDVVEPVDNEISIEENSLNSVETNEEPVITESNPVETIIDENIQNVIDIKHIKPIQQDVLSIYNDLSNISDNILNEYDAFSNDFPSLNTNVVTLANDTDNIEENISIEDIFENFVEDAIISPEINKTENIEDIETPNLENIETDNVEDIETPNLENI